MGKLPGAELLGTRDAQPSSGVAQYRGSTGEEADAGLARAKVGEAMVSEGVALESAGGTIEKLVAIETEKNDATKVEDAWNQYKNQAVNMTAGENGVLRLKAGDAVNSNMLQKTTQNLDALRTQMLEGLSNNDQKRRFVERADTTDLQVKHQVLQHLAVEQTEYAKVVMQGNEATAKTMVAAQPDSTLVFTEARDTLMRQADAFLDRNGIRDKDARDAYRTTLSDGLWTKRIDSLLYDRPALADALFRANKDEIKNPELRLTLQAKTREVGLAVASTQDAQRFVQETRASVPAFYARVENPQAELTKINNALKSRPDDVDLIQAKYAIENGVTEPNTSGLPNSRDVAAQLPLALGKVEKAATDRYGPDTGNPDRVAYVARTKAAVTAIIQQDVHQLAAIQEQAAGQLLDAVGGVTPAGPNGVMPAGGAGAQGGRMKMTSFAQIQNDPNLMAAYQKLDYKQKLVVQNALDSNLKKDEVGDPSLYNELRNRISLPPNDPNKINWWQGVTQDPRVIAGKLNIAQLNSLRSTLDQDSTDDGRSQLATKKAGENLVRGMFQSDMILTDAGTNKGKADYAQALWAQNADKIVGIYKQQNKDIRLLFDPDPKNLESLVTPRALAAFKTMAGSAQSTAGALANAADAQRPAAVAPVQMPTTVTDQASAEAWFKTLPANVDRFVGPDGKTRMVPNRALSSQSATTPVNVGTAQAAAGQVMMDKDGNLVGPSAAGGTVVMDPSGQIVEQKLAPAPVAQSADDIPTLIEGPTKPKGARTEEQKVAAAARLQDYMENAIKGGLWLLTGPVQFVSLVNRAAGEFIQQVKKLSPSEEERAVNGFRSLVRQGTFRANEDTVVMLNNFLASKKGTETENVKAQKMLKVIGDKLGVDTTPIGASGSGGGDGGSGMTKLEAEAAAKSGIFDDNDRTAAGFKPAQPSGTPATATGYRTGTDDQRGSVTKAQEEQLRGMLKGRGFTAAQIDAEVAKMKKR